MLMKTLSVNRGAGNDCLNLNFGKISHRFTRDFTNIDNKIRK